MARKGKAPPAEDHADVKGAIAIPPKRQRACLASRMAERGETWETLLMRIANGEPIARIAADYGVTRGVLWHALRETPERYAATKEALRCSAAAHVEKALDDLESVDVKDPILAPIALRKSHLLSDFRRWLAGRLDREQFGDGPPAAGIQIGSIFINALREANRAALTPVSVEPSPAPPLLGEGAHLEPAHDA